METRKGVIQGIERSEGTNPKGKWVRHCFTIDDKKYSTFDEGLAAKFKIGDYVEMSGEQQGQYWNMNGMKKLEGEAPKEDFDYDGSKNVEVLRLILAELKTITQLLTKKE